MNYKKKEPLDLTYDNKWTAYSCTILAMLLESIYVDGIHLRKRAEIIKISITQTAAR